MLYSEVSKWLEMPSLSLSHEAVHLFLRGVQGWLSDGNIPVLPGSEVDGAKLPSDSYGTLDPYIPAGQSGQSGVEAVPCGTSREGGEGDPCS